MPTVIRGGVGAGAAAAQRIADEERADIILAEREEALLGRAPETVATSLADVSLGKPTGLQAEAFTSIDKLIKSRTQPPTCIKKKY